MVALEPPVAIGGDFNQAPDLWLAGSPVVVSSPVLPTYPVPRPQEPIDDCLVRGGTARAEALSSLASDHLPLLVRLEVATGDAPAPTTGRGPDAPPAHAS